MELSCWRAVMLLENWSNNPLECAAEQQNKQRCNREEWTSSRADHSRRSLAPDVIMLTNLTLIAVLLL